MKMKINKSNIDKLEPREKPYEMGDTSLAGFLVRIQPSGSKSYYYSYTALDGARKRICIGKTSKLSPAQARNQAKSAAGKVAAGIDIQKQKKTARSEAKKKALSTPRNFMGHQYNEWARHNRKSGEENIYRITSQFDWLMDTPMGEITPSDIDTYRSKRLGEGKLPVTINRNVSALKGMISKAVEWDILEHHPLAKVRPLKEEQNLRVRYLNKEEEVDLRSAAASRDQKLKARNQSHNEWRSKRGYNLVPSLADRTYADYLTPMILLAINTGLRRGELLNLNWSHIDPIANTLTVAASNAKSGKARHIPLNKEAIEVLNAWKQGQESGYVFPGQDGKPMTDIKGPWSRLLKKADIKNFRFHDLRHHFASRLVMADVSLNVVRELLGHSTIAMTLRYAHLAPEHHRAAVEKLNQPTET